MPCRETVSISAAPETPAETPATFFASGMNSPFEGVWLLSAWLRSRSLFDRMPLPKLWRRLSAPAPSSTLSCSSGPSTPRIMK